MSATNSRKESHTYSDTYAAWIPAIAIESYTPAEEETEEPSAALAVPENFHATAASSSSVSLAWDAVEAAEDYEVVWYTAEVNLQRSYTDGLEYHFSEGLQPGTSYYFAVRSHQTIGGEDVFSDWSCIAQATDPAAS